MKKGILFLGAAAILGIGSAFTTVSNVGTGEYYKSPSGLYVLKGEGICHENDPEYCGYSIVDPQGDMFDDLNFTADVTQPGRWEE